MVLNFVTRRFIKILEEYEVKLVLEPEYKTCGYLLFPNGKRFFFKGTCMDINGQGAASIARDKGFTNYFLKQNGFSVPRFDTFTLEKNVNQYEIKNDIHAGYAFAEQIGFPVILKPNEGAKGYFVNKVYDKEDYYASAREIFEHFQVLMVQEYVGGNDYRVTILDDKVYFAYQRVPVHIIGNGVGTVKDLLLQKQAEVYTRRKDHLLSLDDPRILKTLESEQVDFSTILPAGEKIDLLKISNLSYGDEMVDMTDQISPAYQKLFVDAVKSAGLRMAGIDVRADSISGPVGAYHIIEINSAPIFSSFAGFGEKQLAIVDNMYRDLVKKLLKEPVSIDR